jgi:hypothetical protein
MLTTKFPQPTLDFINCVTNPFSCAVPARIVDNDPQASLPWKDYSINNGLSITVNGTTTACQGLALFLLIGSNRFAENSVISNSGYALLGIPLTAGGVAIGQPTSVIPQANYANLGNYGSYYRFVAAGLRCKCMIEEVTVSTTVAVSRMYTGLLKPSDAYTSYSSATSMFSLAQQMDCLKTFGNNQGATVRLDPFQQIIDFKKYRSTGDWTNYGSFDGNTYTLPSIILEFMNPVPIVTTAGNSTYTFPLIIEDVFWLELLLNKPTPLFAMPSPCDMNYEFIAQVISRSCEGEFPVVVSFNSFANFIKGVGRFGVAASKALLQTSILPMAVNAVSTRYGLGPILKNEPLLKRKVKQSQPQMKKKKKKGKK